jgi:hypothetical protein
VALPCPRQTPVSPHTHTHAKPCAEKPKNEKGQKTENRKQALNAWCLVPLSFLITFFWAQRFVPLAIFLSPFFLA